MTRQARSGSAAPVCSSPRPGLAAAHSPTRAVAAAVTVLAMLLLSVTGALGATAASAAASDQPVVVGWGSNG